MGYLILVVVVGFIVFTIYHMKQESGSIQVESRVRETTIPKFSKEVVIELKPLPDNKVLDTYGMGKYTKKERWSLDFYGGKHTQGGDSGVKVVEYEGYSKSFRRDVCRSTNLISEKELIEFNQNYLSDYHPIIEDKMTRGSEVSEIKRHIRKTFIDGHIKNYDKNTKTWKDFDVNGMFLRVRGSMMDTNKPFPPYVWNLVSGNPFDRVFRIGRDYTKWKGTLGTSKTLFDNVCKWENGEIFREGEPNKEFEIPLWVNWNVVGKVFLSFKTKLKKDSPEGLEWLKETVGGYIRERKEFYDQFGEDSEYYISDELLEKYSNLK